MRKRLTILEFIEKAKKVHGDRYNYELVEHKKSSDKVSILCNIHNKFEQTPNNHLNGQGCPKCSHEKQNILNTYTNTEFINKAISVHGVKYDYSSVNYLNNKIKINIICNKHGMFKQKPTHHLQGSGCQICNESKGEQAILEWLKTNNIYFIHQKRFIDCRDKQPLPFDFYLPDYNTCIEYDGRHHFESINEWGGIGYLLDIQRKDSIKTNYCKINNIKLIRINYKEMNCENFKYKLENQ